MKKILIILLSLISISVNAQFIYNNGKSTAKVDTVRTKGSSAIMDGIFNFKDDLVVRDTTIYDLIKKHGGGGTAVIDTSKIATVWSLGDTVRNLRDNAIELLNVVYSKAQVDSALQANVDTITNNFTGDTVVTNFLKYDLPLRTATEMVIIPAQLSKLLLLDNFKIFVTTLNNTGLTQNPVISIGNNAGRNNILSNYELTSLANRKVYKWNTLDSIISMDSPIYLKVNTPTNALQIKANIQGSYTAVNDNSFAYQPETNTLLSRYSVQPNLNGKLLIDSCFKAFKDSALFSKLEVFYAFCVNDSAGALQNWVSNTYNATAFSGMTFTAKDGFLSNGTSGYINTNFIPSTNGVKFQTANAAFAIWVSQIHSGSNFIHGVSAGGVQDWIGANSTNNRLNGTSVLSSNNVTGLHLLTVDQTAQNVRYYANGAYVRQSLQVTYALPTASIHLFKYNGASSYVNDRLSFMVLSSALTDVEARKLYNILNWFKTRAANVF